MKDADILALLASDRPAEPSPIAGVAAVFPENIGAFLRDVLDPPPVPGGPPWTHTFPLPLTEYDDDGEPLPRKIEPSFTVTRAEPERPTWLGGHARPTTGGEWPS